MKYSTTAFAVLLFLSVGAHGSTIVSVQSVGAAAGGSGAFDVSLNNTGSSTITVGAFTFGISTTNTAISFVDANTSTVLGGYIFAGKSLFGPDLTGPSSGQSLSVSDVFATPLSGALVAPGATLGPGHVLFVVGSNSATGAFTISLVGNPATSLSDPSGNVIAIDTLGDGTVNITGAPEPSSLFLVLMGFSLVWVKRRFSTRTAGIGLESGGGF